jgi:hypothetical protein
MSDQPSPRKSSPWLIYGASAVGLLLLVAGVAYWRMHGFGGSGPAGGNGPLGSQTTQGAKADGSLGQTATTVGGKTYAIGAPFLRAGDRMVVSAYAEHPGRPRGPAWLLLVRLNDKWNTEAIGEWGGRGTDTGVAYGHASYTARDGKLFAIQYELNAAPPPEFFSLGGKAHDLAAGRVFLIDLRTEPVSVTQLREDVAAWLPNQDARSEELENSVKELEARNETVRQFWQAE